MEIWAVAGLVLAGILGCVGLLWLYNWCTKPRITPDMIKLAQYNDLGTGELRAQPISPAEARQALYRYRDGRGVASPAAPDAVVWFKTLPL